MPFLNNAFRTRRASLLALGVVALLGSCTDVPEARPTTESTVSSLGNDAGTTSCTHPDEGCPCAPGDMPVECVPTTPVMVNGRVMCQHGTRSCRDGLWSACEDITLFAPTGNKILGPAGAVSVCRPDDFIQTSTPDATDLTPTNSTNLDYTTTNPSGLVLVTIPPANVVNMGLGPDTDGDGVPDTVDDCPADNTRWRAPCAPAAFTEQGFFHILPPGATATDPMTVNLTVKTVDTYLLIDTTASMDGEIANLRTGITNLMSTIQTVIPGANLGIGMFRDFPVKADSNLNDFPYIHLLDPTSSLATAQNITNQVLDVEGNYYWPEGGAQALYSVASGRGLGSFVGNRTCSNGGFGWPCFRSGTVPVVILVTDAPFWNGASFATTDTLRRRTELSYPPYPGTNGTDFVAAQNLPRATVVSSTGQIILSNDTVATAFQIGDMTDRSLTVHGANNGVSTPLVNNFTETCGTRTPSGPDVFYTFTIDTPRHFIFEAFADFDPTLYLRRVSGSTTSTMACDLDSAGVADGNGSLVWRTGSKIDTRAIPGVGSTTTNVTLTGCNASASDVPTPMTNCSVATSTTNASLTGCTIPSATFTSNLSGCAVDNTPTVSTFTGCSVPSSTTSSVSGCSFENTTTSAGLSGCTIPSSTTTSTFSGCTLSTTTTANFTGCQVQRTDTNVPLTNCNQPSSTVNFSGCTPATNTTTFSGCNVTSAGATTTRSWTGCQTGPSSLKLNNCDLTNGSNVLTNCDLSAGTPPVGAVLTFGTGSACGDLPCDVYVVSVSGNNVTVSGAATATRNNEDYYARGDSYLTGCTGASPPIVGMTLSGRTDYSGFPSNARVIGYSGSGTYTIGFGVRWGAIPYMTPTGTGSPATTTGTIINTYPTVTSCNVSSGAAPSVGMAVTGTGVPAGTTITSVTGSGPYSLVLSQPLTGGTYSVTSGTTRNRSQMVSCTITSGSGLSAGMSLSGSNLAGGTTLSSFTGSGSGPYTLNLSAAATSDSASVTSASGTNRNRFENCRVSSGSNVPTNGMSASGTAIASATTISNVTSTNVCTWYVWPIGCLSWQVEYAMDLSQAATSSSADLTSVFSSVYDRSRMTSCTLSSGGPVANGMTLTGTSLAGGATISSFTGSGSGPYTLVMSAAATSDAATVTSASSTTVDRSRFRNCTLVSGPNPTSGQVVAGMNLGAGTTTVNGTPTLSGGVWTIPITPNAAADNATLTSTSTTTYTTNRVTGCTRTSGTLQNGQTVTGTNLPSSPVVANLSGSGTGPYAFDFGTVGSSTTLPTYTVTGASITTPDLTHMINCAVTGLAPAAGDVLGGTGVSGTVASATGAGPYRINFSTPASSASATLTSLTRTTAPQLDRLTGCVLSSGSSTPTIGMALTGTSLIATGAPTPTITNATLSGGTYTILMSRNASAAGSIATVTGTSNNYNLNRLVNCAVGGNPLQVGMTLTGTSLAANTTVTGITPLSGGLFAINLSAPATATNATAMSGTITVNYLNRMDGCTLASGSLIAGMGLTGSLLTAGTTIASFSGSGTGPYTINLSQNATATGATTANATITQALPQLVGCLGNFLLNDGTAIQGPGIPAGTTITTVGGLGTASNPWVLDLSATPTTISTNTTFNAMLPGLSNQLTGCMISAGGPLIDASGVPPGMAMSGTLIAPGSTLTLATGTGSGPYTLTLSEALTGTGATDASGTITINASGGSSPLAPGTYQLVVDSSTFNAASASAPGRGTFQLRITNLQQQQTTSTPYDVATTQATEVSWGTTVDALKAAGIKTIGVASCPAGCTDLATRQDAYATCVQGATPTTTMGADHINTSATYCGAAYNRCVAVFGAAQSAKCVTVFNQCRQAEISAGQQNLNVRSNSCTAARSACNSNFANSTTNCTSVYNYCYGGSGYPATAAVCTTQASAVSTCLSASASGSSDAATYCDETLYDLGQMGVATGSVRADGTPFVYQISENGSGLSATIADGVRELARYILFDVTARCEDPLGTGACTTLFSNAVIDPSKPSPVGQVPGCQSCTGPTCLRCTPGANLPYQINFANTGVNPTTVPQTFDFFIVLRDATGAEMSRAPVRIVVPPDNPSTVAPSGSFRQIYDGTYNSSNNTGCLYPGRRAKWGNFTYTATLPAGTSIRFEFKTANTIPELASASPASVMVTASATNAVIDVDALLTAAGLQTSQYLPYLQVTSTLNADASLTRTPVLQTYNLEYTCVDAE